MTVKKVFFNGKLMEVGIGTEVIVATCGSGHTYFGEFATLKRFTKTNMVFETESGSIVKTQIDTFNTVGKAAKNNYFVSPIIEGRDDMISRRVMYWNDKNHKMEYK